MATTPLYKLKNYKDTLKFELEHPKSLRWEAGYKRYMLEEEDNVQGIWLKEKADIVGELILSWKSTNVAYINSFTVVPTHRGQGYGHDLVKLAIEWATEFGFEFITGEARKGACYQIFENFGAVPVLEYKNWTDTKEDYTFFKIKL